MRTLWNKGGPEHRISAYFDRLDHRRAASRRCRPVDRGDGQVAGRRQEGDLPRRPGWFSARCTTAICISTDTEQPGGVFNCHPLDLLWAEALAANGIEESLQTFYRERVALLS